MKGKIYAHWLEMAKEINLLLPRDSAWREKFKRNFKWNIKPELGQWVDNPTQFTHSDINLIWTIESHWKFYTQSKYFFFASEVSILPNEISFEAHGETVLKKKKKNQTKPVLWAHLGYTHIL